MQKNDSNARFTEKQGQLLVKLARKTILNKLAGKSPGNDSDALVPALQDESLQAHCGTFVTLKIQGQLRGCIGNLTSTESVLDGVKRNAVNAAFHDPRFSSLSRAELDRTEIEVSILTEPLPLAYRDSRGPDPKTSRPCGRRHSPQGPCQCHLFTPGMGSVAPT